MNILGIDTSTKKANVCIKKNNNIINKTIDNEITHSEKLLPLIDQTLKDSKLSLKEINYLACSIGPGSFTGIRIGIATIKAFAKVLDVPIFAVSSLDILAYTDIHESDDYIISIMDAKNFRIYYSVYKVNKLKYYGKLIPVLSTILDYSNDIIDDALDNINNIFLKEDLSTIPNLKIIGDCSEIYEEVFINKLDYLFKTISIHNANLSGESLINMLSNYIKLGFDDNHKKDYLTLDALYVRPSQAERAKNNEA